MSYQSNYVARIRGLTICFIFTHSLRCGLEECRQLCWLGSKVCSLCCFVEPITHLQNYPITQCPHCPITSGSPFFVFPITTIFALGLLARDSVASMPFHCNNCGLMPWATIC